MIIIMILGFAMLSALALGPPASFHVMKNLRAHYISTMAILVFCAQKLLNKYNMYFELGDFS